MNMNLAHAGDHAGWPRLRIHVAPRHERPVSRPRLELTPDVNPGQPRDDSFEFVALRQAISKGNVPTRELPES